MVQNGQEVRHHEVDRTLTDRDKATCQQAIGIGHCIGQYRPDKRSPLDITRFEASYVQRAVRLFLDSYQWRIHHILLIHTITIYHSCSKDRL
jgi:hypothetical protein